MRALAAIALGACATAPAPAPVPAGAAPAVAIEMPAVGAPAPEEDASPTRRIDPIHEAEQYLTGAPPDRLARVAFYGPLYASEPDGETAPLAGELEESRERKAAWEGEVVAVVEERAGSLRVVIEDFGVRLVAYLAREDLRPVVRRRTLASLGAREVPTSSSGEGAWLRPGVVANERVGSFRSAAIDDPIFTGTAWFAQEAVDEVYEPEADAEDATLLLLERGSLIATAAGRRLVTTTADHAVERLETKGSLARIRYQSDVLVIEGWVPATRIRDEEPPLFGEGGGGRGWGTSGRTVFLHAGDRLRAGPGGEVIGLVVEDRVRAMDYGEEAGGRSVTVHLGGWSVPLWISAEDAAYGERWERVYAQRVRIEPLPRAPALPSFMTTKHDIVSDCWAEAMDRSPKALSLRLTWTGGQGVDVPAPPGIDPALHGCLSRAFARIYARGDLPALPLSFMLHLEPTKLPERPGAE